MPETQLTRLRRSLGELRWLAPAALWYLALRVAVLLGLLLGDLITHERLSDKLTRWDGRWFLDATVHGWPRHLVYEHGHVVGNPIAFFPALPLSIRWLSSLSGLPVSLSGVLLSGLTGLTATMAIGLLVAEYRSRPEALRAAILFAVFPGSFVFSLIYAEGLVLSFMALGLVCLLRRRWLWAGVAGVAATFTSPIGLAFVVACVWAALADLRARRDPRALLAPLLAPIGFAFYMWWLWRHTGVLDAWRLTERGGWHSYPSLRYPFTVLWRFASNPIGAVKTTDLLVIGLLVTALGLYWAFRQRQPGPVLAYATGAVVLAALSDPVGLRPRFILLAFPVIIAWALRFEGRSALIVRWVSVAAWAALTVFEFYSWAVFP